MSKHVATVEWTAKPGEDFLAGRYSRVHSVRFDGGVSLEGSAAPGNAPAAFISERAVDPEEMFVASISSCHMLWFLHLARKDGVTVSAYRDIAEGVMATGPDGRISITRVVLRPAIDCDADQDRIDALHERAHEACFIANSVRTDITVEQPQEA